MKKGWEAHVLGEAPHTFKDATTAVTTLRVSGWVDGGGGGGGGGSVIPWLGWMAGGPGGMGVDG